MARPDLQRIPEYYHKYIAKAEGDDLRTVMAAHKKTAVEFLRGLPAEKWAHRYAAGKWSIKEIVQHIIDTERVFNYRALAFARNDQTMLPGFDENAYAKFSGADRRTPEDLLEELAIVQAGTAALFLSFSEEQLQRGGHANNYPNYVLGMAYINAGHALHHLAVIRERYLA